MLKINFTSSVLLFIVLNTLNGQDFGDAPSCTENVNKQYLTNFFGKENLINSSFKITWQSAGGSNGKCTGTLINREVPYNQLGYYFITSRHCIVQNESQPNSPLSIDLNLEQHLMFNYQSKDEFNNGTELSNRGFSSQQSTSWTDDDYQYIHKSKLRLVERYFWGDFALFEILTPIPPHFGVTYAGWNVRPIALDVNCTVNGGVAQFTNYSHSEGDIKKLSGACTALDLTTPIATSCYTIMTVINTITNFILNFFNTTFNFTTICQYVDNPWVTVPFWDIGGIAPGSSGSGIFATKGAPVISFQDNRYVGTLSGGLFNCGTPTTFTKFYHNYPKTAVYSTLNPNNDWVAQTFGVGGRYTTCYDNLNNLSGYYFPKNHIGPNNFYQMSTIGDISNDPNKTWKFISGSDYKLTAQNSILFSAQPNVTSQFVIESGSNVEFKIEPCTNGAYGSFRTGNTNANASDDIYYAEKQKTVNELITSAKSIKLPQNKVFSEKEYMKKYHPEMTRIVMCEPNPSNGIFKITTTLAGNKKISLKNTFAQKLFQLETIENSFEVDLSNYPRGIYNLSVFNGEENLFIKLVKE